MLLKRLFSALLLIPVVLIGIFYTSLNSFWVGIALLLSIAAAEWANMFDVRGSAKIITISLVLGLCWFLPSLANNPNILLYSNVVFWLATFVSVVVYNFFPHNKLFCFLRTKPCGTIVALILGLWMLLGLGLVLFLLKLTHNELLLVIGLVLIWTVDTGAYLTGKYFGGGKLIPNVSPSKTWSGAVGGLLSLLCVAGIIYYGFTTTFNNSDFTAFALYTLVIYIFAVFGDLAESMFKRISGVKDSGRLIPGHGGILDRIDSIIAVLPIYWIIIDNIK